MRQTQSAVVNWEFGLVDPLESFFAVQFCTCLVRPMFLGTLMQTGSPPCHHPRGNQGFLEITRSAWPQLWQAASVCMLTVCANYVQTTSLQVAASNVKDRHQTHSSSRLQQAASAPSCTFKQPQLLSSAVLCFLKREKKTDKKQTKNYLSKNQEMTSAYCRQAEVAGSLLAHCCHQVQGLDFRLKVQFGDMTIQHNLTCR